MQTNQGHTTVGGGGIIRGCCVERNLEPPVTVGDGVTMRRCAKCGRRHFVAKAEPGRLGVVGAVLGC